MSVPITVYVAAPRECVNRARVFANRVDGVAGLKVISTWHDAYTAGDPDPDARAIGMSTLGSNLAELRRARVVVALLAAGAGLETYVEIGRALEHRIPVIMSAERGGLPLSRWDERAAVMSTDDVAFLALCSGGLQMRALDELSGRAAR